MRKHWRRTKLKVAFELAGDHVRIRKTRRETGRGRLVLEALRGTADVRMNTDEIMALTRPAHA